MTDFNAKDFEGMLDFFLLSGFSDGPRSFVEIQQRVSWAERLLVIAAAKRGTEGSGSLAKALKRLQHEGWLNSGPSVEQPSPQTTYSLTEAGRQRLQEERERYLWQLPQHSIEQAAVILLVLFPLLLLPCPVRFTLADNGLLLGTVIGFPVRLALGIGAHLKDFSRFPWTFHHHGLGRFRARRLVVFGVFALFRL